jgi:DNA-directed RNA polymerase subunit omega
MDPHIVFDCEKVLPNRFDLAVAAAARVRALSRGGEPRIRISDTGRTELALREIAAGAFEPDELAPFMRGLGEVKRLASSDPPNELCGDSASAAAAAPLSRRPERVH